LSGEKRGCFFKYDLQLGKVDFGEVKYSRFNSGAKVERRSSG